MLLFEKLKHTVDLKVLRNNRKRKNPSINIKGFYVDMRTKPLHLHSQNYQ